MAVRFQIWPQLLEVIYLAIADYPDSAILICDGLVPSFQVYDAEAAHADSDTVPVIVSLVVRTPVNHHSAHAFQHALIRLPASSQFKYAVYATHCFFDDVERSLLGMSQVITYKRCWIRAEERRNRFGKQVSS
jgi:hypothetical protein